MASKFQLGRRAILQGILGGTAVSIALPPLEAMLNSHGEAFADGTPFQSRFLHFFWGNGVKPDRFFPTTTGTGWTSAPPESIVPFKDKGVIDYVSLASKLWVPFPFSWAHATSYMGMMTASQPLDDSGAPDYSTGKYPSRGQGPMVMDVITQALGKGYKFPRIDLQVSRAVSGADYLAGDRNAALYNPAAAFTKLFAGVSATPGQAVQPDPGLLAARKTVLDAVADDASAMRKRLGAADQLRLDQHLDSVRTLQSRVTAAVGTPACVIPTAPGARPADRANNGEELETINDAMASLTAYALACDLSRVVNYTFTGMQVDAHFWQVNSTMAAAGQHGYGHTEPGKQPNIQATVVFIMKQLATLAAALKAVPVPGGNLLDYSCIWGASEIEDPTTHGFYNIPNIVIGKAGGKLKGGVHFNGNGDPNWQNRFARPEAQHARLLLTMMRAVGMDIPSFGVGQSAANTTIKELEA